MFDFLRDTPIDDSVVAANHVIRAIEYRQDIAHTLGLSGEVTVFSNLSNKEQAVARNIVEEIAQAEGLPIGYLTDEAASEYTALLAETIQSNVRDQLSKDEIKRGKEFLKRLQRDESGIEVFKPSNNSTRLTYLILGAGIGAALALLMAPKSGVAMRDDIADATRSVRNPELHDLAGAEESATRVRDAARRQAGSIQAAVEAGKKAYVEEKRKTELSGRTETAPIYKPERAM